MSLQDTLLDPYDKNYVRFRNISKSFVFEEFFFYPKYLKNPEDLDMTTKDMGMVLVLTCPRLKI